MRISDWSSDVCSSDLANTHYDKAIKLDPDRGEYVHNQGLVYQERGRNAEALERFREAVKLAPREIPLQFSLAKSLWRNGRFEESWNYFDAGLVANLRKPNRRFRQRSEERRVGKRLSVRVDLGGRRS